MNTRIFYTRERRDENIYVFLNQRVPVYSDDTWIYLAHNHCCVLEKESSATTLG